MAKYLAFGDTHGHLQLVFALVYLAQEELGEHLEALFLVGDVGVFPWEERVDSATRKHARKNLLNLDFTRAWANLPWPPWIEKIFLPKEEGGLGVSAPAVMVNGNHEDFDYLRSLLPENPPQFPVALEDLPPVDPKGKIRYLPSGWVLGLPSGLLVAGLGGIEADKDAYPKYIRESDALRLLNLYGELGPFDLLLTHQGPAKLQGSHGSRLLDALLGTAKVWFHGHSTPKGEPEEVEGTLVFPLRDITFKEGPLPPSGSSALVEFEGGEVKAVPFQPKRAPELALFYWKRTLWRGKGVLVCPLTA